MNKIVYTISLLCITFLMTFQNGLMVAYFYANQSEIVQRFCENKDKPQLHCDGKCYLKKQIVQVESQKQEQATNVKLSYVLLEVVLEGSPCALPVSISFRDAKSLFHYQCLSPQSVILSHFRPPAFA